MYNFHYQILIMIKVLRLIKEKEDLNKKQLLNLLKSFYFKALLLDYQKVGHNHLFLRRNLHFLDYIS